MPICAWRRVALTVIVAGSAACATMPARTPTISTEGELKLTAGAFPALAGTALGDPVKFENDIYSATCFPLFAVSGHSQTVSGAHDTGTILLWISRAHVAGGRVIVAPCEVAAPFEASSTQIGGAVSASWFEVALIAESGRPRVSMRRLDVPGWGEFSAPAFCGRRVAFWSLKAGGELTAHVADLFDSSRRSSSVLGKIEIAGSDMGWGVGTAVWSADCSAAVFDTGAGLKTTIRVRR